VSASAAPDSHEFRALLEEGRRRTPARGADA
jgi:hypothetical protein